MPHYRRVGHVPRKRHTVHLDESGERLAEELIGQHGFSGASTLLYHRSSPSAITAATSVRDHRRSLHTNEPLLPRHLRTSDLEEGGDVVRHRHLLLGNADVAISWVAATESSGLYRNAGADELVYVHEGSAMLESTFGRMSVSAGDYVVIPRAAVHRWVLAGSATLSCLIVEATGHLRAPARYLTDAGQFREGSPFCERDIRAPDETVVEDGRDVEVLVRQRDVLTTYCHASHPFDVVGWDGCLYPWALSVHDFEPVVGRFHQPPPVHQTFEAPGVVVCSFVPRPLDFGEGAVKVPYHHSNVDSDEVLFYAEGDFTSRVGSGIGRGSISLHPAGFVHGPQPGSFERSRDASHTNEVAVMIDTFDRLGLSDAARAVSDRDYPWSWAGAR